MSTSYTNPMPTPPFSPQVDARMPQNLDPSLKSTANMLDSLVSFYQQERMWVYRTRAQLEEEEDSDPSDCSNVGQSESSRHALTLPPLSTTSRSDTIDTTLRGPGRPSTPTQSASRWSRRKKAFKLRLDNLKPQHNRRALLEQSVAMHKAQTDESQSSVRILEMYDTMLESRMESCQRINRLIRNANRAYLHHR
ncbi:hypothetical protein HGRIS_009470 [Hohenbuehelia grisea]|uniref:Uncharacterized protein n=1 Tax=Hohenbuehelia grisea TaxID=104357 RepID=A0ABR3J1N0_9AGAR